MTKFAFSQTGYPKVLVFEGDTIVAISRAQLRVINLTKIELERYKELNQNLQEQVAGYDAIIVQKDAVVTSLKKESTIQEDQFKLCTEFTDVMQEVIKTKERELKKQKLIKNVYKTLFFAATGVAVFLGLK